jgi:putative molybdopterin biosynthesis protein
LHFVGKIFVKFFLNDSFFPNLMQTTQPLANFDQIKLLSDPRRMEILRLLMGAPYTLTQLGARLQKHPAWVQHHLKALLQADLVELSHTVAVTGYTEKYYRARAGAFFLQEIILPNSPQPIALFSGSHDLALERLADLLAPHLTLIAHPVGSLDGLVSLRQGLCHLAGAHILDANGEYNTPTVRHLFPDRPVQLVTLVNRTQGLLLAPGNPQGIQTLFDLTRQDVTFLQRNPGSGTRIWLERELARIGLPPTALPDNGQIATTHTAAARAVQTGAADVTLGIQAAAQAHGLDFIPLFEERYDLIFPFSAQTALAPLLESLQTSAFRKTVNTLAGYNHAHSGQSIAL